VTRTSRTVDFDVGAPDAVEPIGAIVAATTTNAVR
jgi:hypothetical protein